MFGTVRFFSPRGFGFIRPNDGSEDIYFHCAELPGQRGARYITEGTFVEYEVGTFQGKPAARNIVVVGDGDGVK